MVGSWVGLVGATKQPVRQHLIILGRGTCVARDSLADYEDFLRCHTMNAQAIVAADAAVRVDPLTILIVDDNPDAAESLARVLGAYGHRCRVMHSGWNVRQIALGMRPHAILLDIALPGITGYEVAKEIREQRALQGVLLIAISGYAAEKDSQRSFESGFDHHLVKPIDIDVLLRLLADHSTK